MATKKGTAVAKAGKMNLPANIDAEMQAEVAALSSRLNAPTGNRISCTLKKTFKLPDGLESPGPMNVVIVDFITAHYYYPDRYDPDNIVPPDCFALGLDPKAMIASANSKDKQCDSCNACWAFQFGSDGKGKACKTTRLLAVMQPDADRDSPLMLLRVPPTSSAAFDGYVAGIARTYQKPVRGVITEISFDDKSDYSKLLFGNPEECDAGLLALAHSRKDEAMQLLMTEPEYTEAEQSAPAVKKLAAKGAAKGGSKKPAASARR